MADNWTKTALRDGGVVAELLLSLKEAQVTPVFLANQALTTLRWGIRQPRSRSPRCEGDLQRKEADSAKNSRCSPNTPLSWSENPGGSGGGSYSPSAYLDGYEATSRQINGSMAVGSKSTEFRNGGRFKENDKLKRRKVTHQIHRQDSDNSFLLPDLNMMPSQNDNLHHYFSPHVETFVLN